MKWKNIWSSGPKATAGAQQTQETLENMGVKSWYWSTKNK